MKKMTASQFKLDPNTGICYGNIADCLDVNGDPEVVITVECVNYTRTYHISAKNQKSGPPYYYSEINTSWNGGLPRQTLKFS